MRKETAKTRAEIKEIEEEKQHKINRTEIWIFEKISKINKCLGKLAKEKERRLNL